MKVKLLKKIRRRYQIIHYPNGGYFHKIWYEGPLTCLIDTYDSWRMQISNENKDLAYILLRNHLMTWIENDYKISRKRKNSKKEILWYN